MNDRLTLLRARNLGETLSDSFGFHLPNWKVFAAVAGPAVMVGILLQLLLLLLMPEQISEDATQDEITQYLQGLAPPAGIFLLVLPVMWVIYQLTAAGVVVVLQKLARGEEVTAGDALDAAQDRTRDLLLASLKSTAALILLCVTIIGIPFAIYQSIRWTLIVQSIMVDGVSHREALQHSAYLVQGAWWYTFARLLVAGILIGLLSSSMTAIIGAIIPGVPGVILAGCVGFFSFPFPIIFTSLIFFDRKARQAQPPAFA